VSRALDPVVPPPLAAVLARDPDPAEGFTILILTVSEGWPHLAMTSVGEIVARDERNLALALWPGSSTTRALESSGRATLAAVVAHVSYPIREEAARVADLATPLAGTLARFDAVVQSASADEAPYAVIESGVRFTLKDAAQTLARWREVRDALSTT